MLYCRKKLITSYSGFSILNAEGVMVIPDKLTKQEEHRPHRSPEKPV